MVSCGAGLVITSAYLDGPDLLALGAFCTQAGEVTNANVGLRVLIRANAKVLAKVLSQDAYIRHFTRRPGGGVQVGSRGWRCDRLLG